MAWGCDGRHRRFELGTSAAEPVHEFSEQHGHAAKQNVWCAIVVEECENGAVPGRQNFMSNQGVFLID